MVKMIPDDKQLYVSGRIWHELYPKVNPTPFLYALYEGIDLTKYGDGLHKFFFTFIVVLPDDKLHRPGIYYNAKKKEVEVGVAIPYDQIVQATQEETYQLMEEAYLQGIDQLKELPLADHFDVDAFKRDVSAIFATERWYEVVMAE